MLYERRGSDDEGATAIAQGRSLAPPRNRIEEICRVRAHRPGPAPSGSCAKRTRASSSRHRAPRPPSRPPRAESGPWGDGASEPTSTSRSSPARISGNMPARSTTRGRQSLRRRSCETPRELANNSAMARPHPPGASSKVLRQSAILRALGSACLRGPESPRQIDGFASDGILRARRAKRTGSSRTLDAKSWANSGAPPLKSRNPEPDCAQSSAGSRVLREPGGIEWW